MTPNEARRWIIIASLIDTGALFAFLLLAPLMGYPLDIAQGENIRLLEIVLPVFVGYVGAAGHYVFGRSNRATSKSLPPNAALFVKGSFWVATFMYVVAFLAFGLSNRTTSEGMTLDFLAGALTAILGFQAASTGLAVQHLFNVEYKSGASGTSQNPAKDD